MTHLLAREHSISNDLLSHFPEVLGYVVLFVDFVGQREHGQTALGIHPGSYRLSLQQDLGSDVLYDVPHEKGCLDVYVC